MEIIIKPFASNEKGYLRRQMKMARLVKRMESNDVEALDEFVRVIAGRVQGVDEQSAYDALLDLSEDEFKALQKVMTAGDSPLD